MCGFCGGFWRSLCVCRCAFAFVGRKKGLFSAFWGVGCVFGCVWRVPWLLGGFLGERGRGYAHPYLFWFVVLVVLPLLSVSKKIYAKQGSDGVMSEIYILYSIPDRAKIFYETQGYCITRANWRLYTASTCENVDMLQTSLIRLPKNGKTVAKTIRQNAQCKSCGNIANLAMR